MTNEAFVTVLVGIAIAVGIVGTLAPIVPGLVLAWAAMLVYGLAIGFGWVGWTVMTIATALAVLGFYLGFRIPQQSAARTGVSTRGQLIGAVLAVIGFFVIPVIGAPIGFVFGVWLVRSQETGDGRAAWTSTKAAVVALFKASFAQATCGLGMALAWGAWVASNLL